MATTVQARPAIIRTSPLFFANSVLAALLGVVIARLVELFSVGITAMVAGRDPYITNSSVVYTGSDNVEIVGPIGMLVVGSALLLLYPGSRDRSVGRLTMLWTMLFCFRGGLMAVVVGGIDEESVVGRVIVDLGLPEWARLVIAGLALLIMIGIAIGVAPAFLSFGRHRSEVSSRVERARFMVLIGVIPAFVGPLLAAPLLMPENGTGFVSSLPLAGSFILVTLIASLFTASFRPPDVVEERGLSFGLIAAVALVAVVLRLGLEPGVPLPPWDENLHLTLRP